jgi:hypothetical protein
VWTRRPDGKIKKNRRDLVHSLFFRLPILWGEKSVGRYESALSLQIKRNSGTLTGHVDDDCSIHSTIF